MTGITGYILLQIHQEPAFEGDTMTKYDAGAGMSAIVPGLHSKRAGPAMPLNERLGESWPFGRWFCRAKPLSFRVETLLYAVGGRRSSVVGRP